MAGSVGLQTPADELYTYVAMWRLRPYLDDQAVELLLALGGASAASKPP